MRRTMPHVRPSVAVSTAGALAACLFAVACDGAPPRQPAPVPPNIIFILADDLGYGDLGSYGQALIETPRLDRMAAEGMRFRQFYAGATVCAPSRAVLMTGRHTGHVSVRGNAGKDIQTLQRDDVTIAEVLQRQGYATALIGKWGLGEEGTSGLPNDQGFDDFFGYLNQLHAHNYYPEFLWRNRERQPLDNVVVRVDQPDPDRFVGGYATEKVDYSHDLFASAALDWVRTHKDEPFFLYLALTVPHANNEATSALGDGQEVPDYGRYANADWPDPAKGQAAMITRMDTDVGRLLDLVDELGLAERTVVMFSSDNGPHREGGYDPALFDPSGPLRGMKRDLYEGGIRVPLIVRWTGTTPAGIVSGHIGYFGDLMATAADLAGVSPPDGIDSTSFVPEITGQPARQQSHDSLYWEFYERGGARAVRAGRWKAVKVPFAAEATELYDLSTDLGEADDVAAAHPEVVARLEAAMREAHVPDPRWVPSGEPSPPPPPGDGQAPF
jgi:arylsulfatase A-like enzyme